MRVQWADFLLGMAAGMMLNVLTAFIVGLWRSHQASKQGAHFTRTVIAEIERRQRERK